MGTILFLILVISVVLYLQYENYRKQLLTTDSEHASQEPEHDQARMKRERLMNFGAGLWKLLKR